MEMKWPGKITVVVIATVFMLTVVSRAGDKQRSREVEEARLEAERICMSMKPFLERPEKFNSVKIEDVDEINAYADGKNNVTFFTGMLDFVRDENELAAVCGHELAHLSAQHIKRSIFTQIVAGVASEAIGGTLGNVAGNALYTKQSRKHEREADRRGLMYMWWAGYDPRTLWKFWQSIQNAYDQGNISIAKYFSTHPVHAERVENFKVLLVRECKADPKLKYCDEILADPDLVNAFNQFGERD